MNQCILVVEDQPDNRQILRDLLTSANFEVIEAASGEAGLVSAGRGEPPGVAEVNRVEALREPLVDFGQRASRFIPLPSFAE